MKEWSAVVGSNDLTGEHGDDRSISIIDANVGLKKNDHDGLTSWTQNTHLTTPQNPEPVDPLHESISDAFCFYKGI